MPWEEFVSFGSIGSLSRIVGYVTILCALMAKAEELKMRRLKAYHLVVVAFIFWNVLTTFWSIDVESSISRILTYFMLAGMVWLIWEFVRTENEIRGVLSAFIMGCYASLIHMAILSWLGEAKIDAASTRISGGGMNANDLALILSIGIFMAYYLAATSNRRSRIMKMVYYSFCVAAIAGILFTGSRGGVVSLATGVACYSIMEPRVRITRKALFIGTMVIATLMIVNVLPEKTYLRLYNIPEKIETGEFTFRIEIWKAGIEIIKNNMLLGVGTGGFPAAVGPLLGKEILAHNSYISVLAETGLVGLAAFVMLFLISFSIANKLTSGLRPIWLAILTVLAVGLIVHSDHYRKPTWLIFALILSERSRVFAAQKVRNVKLASSAENINDELNIGMSG